MANIIYKESSDDNKINLIKEQIEYINSYIKEIYSQKSTDEIADKEIEIIDKLKKLYKDIGDISELEFQQIEDEFTNLKDHIRSVADKQHKKEYIAMFAAIKSVYRHSIKYESNKQNNKPKIKSIDRPQNKNDIELKAKKIHNPENKESLKIVKSVTKLVTSIRQQIKNIFSSNNDQSAKNIRKQQDSLNVTSSGNNKKHDLDRSFRNNQSNQKYESKNKIDSNENKYVNSVKSVGFINTKNTEFSKPETMVDKVSNRRISDSLLQACSDCPPSR